MANTPDYNWPPMDKRKVIGKPYKRLDGPQKAAGRAKYTSDLKMPDLLYAAYLTCPHAHARVTTIDTSAAEKTTGREGRPVIAEAGKEIQWQGKKSPPWPPPPKKSPREAVRKIKVEYEVLPHFVNEADLAKAGARGKAAGEKVTGDPDKALKEAEAVSERQLRHPRDHPLLPGTPRLRDPVEGRSGGGWPSTQYVTGWAGTLRPICKCRPPTSKCKMDYIGGGFGSKFSPGRMGRSGRASLEEGRRQTGQALPGTRHRTADRGQPPRRLRQDQGRRQEGRHHHRVAIRNLGHRRSRLAAASLRFPTCTQHPQYPPDAHCRCR